MGIAEPRTSPPPPSALRPPPILYLASIDFPHLKARAIQIVNTCHALARAGCRVTLVVGRREAGPAGEHLGRYGLEPHPNLRIVGIPALRIPVAAPAPLRALYTRVWNWCYLAGCLVLLPRLLGGPDQLLMARDYRLGWLLLKLRRWHQRRLVFEVHGLPSAELLDASARTSATVREAARRRALERAVFGGAWRLAAITQCLRERLMQDYGVAVERVWTVPDAAGVRTDDRRPTTDDRPKTMDQGRNDRSALGPSVLRSFGPVVGRRSSVVGRPRLIYVGQLYAHKGVDLAVRALAGVPEAELLIVGGLPDDPERPRLERLARELGLADRVRFAGPRPYRDVPALLATADVALLPLADGLVARCFTSPLKLFDYLAAGLPIVAVDFPTVREILRDGHNALLVPPDDPEAMAVAIERLLADPALAARLGRQAGLDAAEHSWDRRAERLLAALAEPAAARR